MDTARTLLAEVLDAGTRAGEFGVADLDVTAEFLLHAYGGPCYHATDRTRVAQALRTLFHRTVGATTEPPAET